MNTIKNHSSQTKPQGLSTTKVDAISREKVDSIPISDEKKDKTADSIKNRIEELERKIKEFNESPIEVLRFDREDLYSAELEGFKEGVALTLKEVNEIIVTQKELQYKDGNIYIKKNILKQKLKEIEK